MTYQELAERARRLSIQQRLALIDVLTRSLQHDLEGEDQTVQTSAPPQTQPIPPDSTLWRIRGIGATTPALTDAEVEALLTEARMEKYAS